MVSQTVLVLGEEGIDAEIVEQGFPEDTLRAFLHVGYHLYKHHVLKRLNDEAEKNIDMIVEQRVAEQVAEVVDRLRDENLGLARALATKEEDAGRKYLLEVERRDMTIGHLRGLLEESRAGAKALEARIEEIYNGMYTESVQQLKDAIKQRDMEISMLRGTNMVKGQVGEGIIAGALRNIFTDAEVTNTGKTAHVCDVHMEFGGGGGMGRKIVFESKYKGSIEKRDVDKFYRDVEGLGDGVIGGMFVSFVCRNIPNKGSINFEVTREKRRPLMYVAYGDEAEFGMHFPHHVTMFVKLCEAYAADRAGDNGMAVVEEVRFLLDMLNKGKKRLDDIKGRFGKYIAESEEDLRVLLGRLDNVLKRVPNPKMGSSKVFVCSRCQFTCGSKRTLTKHEASCAGACPPSP